MANEPMKPSIADLEKILERGDDETVEILPDGTIRETGRTPARKPLTIREPLGDEYGPSFMDQDFPELCWHAPISGEGG